jgi:tetratricopeptide (TPR) repeat protein
MAETTIVKIFIASSAELAEERKECINGIYNLNESFKDLYLKPVEWEYALVPGNNPGKINIQDAINPKLADSNLAVFLFYSKIGSHTLEEFNYAIKQDKKIFTFFKDNFSPKSIEAIDAFKELLAFKESLNDTVLHLEYTDLKDFSGLLYQKLNQYLVNTYSAKAPDSDTSTIMPQNNDQDLKQKLAETEEELKKVLAKLSDDSGAAINQQIEQLKAEKEEIKTKLLQTEEIIKQQAKDRDDLQKKLSAQQGLDELKAMAYKEVEKGNYSDAELHLQESASISFSEAAATYYELAKIKKLQIQYTEAFAYCEWAAGAVPGNGVYLNEAGLIATDLGQFEKAISYFEKSLDIELKAPGDNRAAIAIQYNNLGLAWYRKGDYDTAIGYYEKALPIDKDIFGEADSRVATIYNNFGLAYYDRGEYEKAIKYYELAVDIYNKTAQEHPQMALLYNNLGLCYCDYKNQFDTAIDYYNKALPLYQKNFGENHPQTAILYNNFGIAWNGKKDFDTAIKYYNQSLSINLAAYGEQHPMVALLYNNIGEAYRQKEDFDTAIEYYEKAIPIDIHFYGEEHPQVAARYNNLALALYYQGNFARAIEYYEKALPVFQKFLPPEHPNIERVKENLDIAKAALEKQQQKP